MASSRPSFAKRDREMKLKDKARAKAERRAARRTSDRTGQGPPIAGDEATEGLTPGADAPETPASTTPAPVPAAMRTRSET